MRTTYFQFFHEFVSSVRLGSECPPSSPVYGGSFSIFAIYSRDSIPTRHEAQINFRLITFLCISPMESRDNVSSAQSLDLHKFEHGHRLSGCRHHRCRYFMVIQCVMSREKQRATFARNAVILRNWRLTSDGLCCFAYPRLFQINRSE
jgi:hypothetical protein